MVDVLGNVVVIQSSAVWIENYKADIQTALRRELRESGLQIDSYVFLWRQSDQRLKQDGYDFPINESDQPETEMIDSNSINQEIIENSVKFLFDPNDGQKTGFYCDQRDNRLLLRSLSLGKDILDTYCYVGGFSINAALGGASRVVAVDSSQQAIDYGIKNARLNGVENKIQYIKMDAIKLMENELAVGNKYDIVVCDPPKLAPTRSSLIKAKNK
jgi:23S rRNA G2069 N7-methylase RlmK/C1962 C5-methylase RlmI